MRDPRGAPVRTDLPLPDYVLSSHKEKDDAWSAFFDAIEEPSAEAARHSSCVASTDTARLTLECAVSHHSTAVHGNREQMNKHELASHVAAGTPVTRADAERLIGVVFSAIADAMARGEPVTIAGFGKFATRSRAARTGRNPRTGEPVAIVASRTPSFKPAKALRDAVNE